MSDDKDYAHVHDPQAQRSRFELWAIVIIAVVVIAGGLIWRAVNHVPAAQQKGYGHNPSMVTDQTTAAAATGVHAASAPAPRPVGP